MNSKDEAFLFACPCCGYPTLKERGGFEICAICFWEDDGQDFHNADQVLGGPNSDYSLTESRENFEKYFTCYRPSDVSAFGQSKHRITWAREVAPLLETYRWKGRVHVDDTISTILKSKAPRFQVSFVSREDRYSLGTDLYTGGRYLSIPVANQMVDYEEYYMLTEVLFEAFVKDPTSAQEFAKKCGRRESDDLLILKPGSDRGTF